MNITQTLEQINQGWNVTSQADILPVYYDGELANGIAYRACQLKHFAQASGHAFVNACDNVKQAVDVIDPSVKWTLGMTIGTTVFAAAYKLLG